MVLNWPTEWFSTVLGMSCTNQWDYNRDGTKAQGAGCFRLLPTVPWAVSPLPGPSPMLPYLGTTHVGAETSTNRELHFSSVTSGYQVFCPSNEKVLRQPLSLTLGSLLEGPLEARKAAACYFLGSCSRDLFRSLSHSLPPNVLVEDKNNNNNYN